VVLAAALCSAGALDKSQTVGAAALEVTGRQGLVPLHWAVACLLIDVGSPNYPTAKLREIRDECARLVRERGGTWSER
ncbi:MAG: hypothetical protein JO082_03600, partial [Mycobacterium sp.]|nr:hypothetical protein [Mycobacterium sp.]